MAKQGYLQLSDDKTHPYSIILSSRAKHIRIRLSDTGQLKLVIPKGLPLKHGIEFIQKKRTWIEKHLNKVHLSPEKLPDYLDLRLLGEKWNIVYSELDSHPPYLKEKESFTLEITGCLSDKVLIKKIMNKWCQYKAKEIFNRLLNDLAQEHGFFYKRLSIRSQKTRWGSCSQDKNINLNSKLIFFKEDIVKYVMIHELCHTIEMNHSYRFWDLVEECDSNYLINRKELTRLGKKLFI